MCGVLSAETKRGDFPSSVRYEHLRALYGTPAEGALYVFCKNIVTSSAIPEDWRPWFFAGKLIALEKGPTDVRPIAMGEVFMKLVGKLVCEGQREEMAELMKGSQFGVAFPGGTEFIHHLLQLCLAQDPSLVLLSLDFSNAFNSVSRAAIASALRKHFPQLLPWFLQMHSASPHLVFRLDDDTVSYLVSDEGCLQGDPLAPFYFALAILEPLRSLKSLALSLDKSSQCLGYLDDVNSVAHGQHIRSLYDFAEKEFKTVCGLSLNPKKCTILVRPETKRLLDEEFPHWVPDGVPVVTDGVRLLGAPVGSDDFVERFLTEKLTSFSELAGLIGDIGDVSAPQVSRAPASLLAHALLPRR